MLYLSVGMPRAGSGWYYNLMHDLVTAGGGADARFIRARYRLGWTLTAVNCNIGSLSPHRMLAAAVPALLGHTYVIKAHAGPSGTARLLMRLGLLRAAYIYRDPRDALLSALEHGKRSRQSRHRNAFAALDDFPAGLRFMQTYVRISEAWLALPGVHTTRYEDLLMRYENEAARLARFLGLAAACGAVEQIVERYRPHSAPHNAQKGLHFRKGRIGRFREVFTPQQQDACREAFGAYLERMGYPP